MRTRLDAQLEGRAPVRGQTRRRVRKHVGVLTSQRGEVRGVAGVDRQRERRPVGSEGDAADDKLRAVGERRAGVGKAGQRVLGPGGRGRRGERGRSSGAPPGGAPKSWAAERWDRTEADGAQERAGLSRREARGRRSRHVQRKVQAHAAARRAATFGAEADLVRFVEEGEVVRAQPVVAEDDVRVAVHVIFHEGRLLVEAAEH